MTGMKKDLFNAVDRVYVDRGIQEALAFLNREDRDRSPYLQSGFYGINHAILRPVTRGLINYEKLSRPDFYTRPDQTLDALNCLALGFRFDLNKTRLLMAVIREAVKSREEPERCLSYLSLYRKVLEGSPSLIRSLLIQKFNMCVLPDKALNSQNGGFDDRVYGSFSLGKRTALQVLVDAYIKGLSRITIVHINEIHREIIPIVLEAGNMLGIDVEFALEFSHGRGKGKHSFLLYFPGCACSNDYYERLDHPVLQSFQNELARVSEARQKAVTKEIRRFNRKVRPGLNKGFENYPELKLPSVSLEDLLKTIKINQLSIPSLGHYLYQIYGSVLQQRIESFDPDEFAPLMGRLKKMKNREVEELVEKVERLDREYHKMDHEEFTARYLSDDLDFSVSIPDFPEHLRALRGLGLDVVLSFPRLDGLPSFLETLLRYTGVVNGVELFNTKYFFNHRESEAELRELVELISIYNQGSVKALFRKARSYGLISKKGERFKLLLADAAFEMIGEGDEGLKIKLGSGSNDYSIASPGMGFLVPRISRLGYRSSLKGLAGHYALPFRLGENPELLPCNLERCGLFKMLGRLSRSSVILLGNPTARKRLRRKEKKISLRSRLKNGNSAVRNSLMIIMGILLSLLPVKGTLAPAYIVLWFLISLLQSVFSDLVSHGGGNLKRYSRALINGRDLASYFFFTGMAIPVLGSISHYVEDALVHSALSAGGRSLVLFLILGLASWIYTGTTTMLRGYKITTAVVNGARSFYSFPLAVLSSLVLPLPPIVQQKVWTAFAGAVVEGIAKYREDLRLRRSDYRQIFREVHLSRTTESRLHSLVYDFLYIRGRQPRGRDVLQFFLNEISPEERDALLEQLKDDSLFDDLRQEHLHEGYSVLLPFMEKERREVLDLLMNSKEG